MKEPIKVRAEISELEIQKTKLNWSNEKFISKKIIVTIEKSLEN
jgi:hypothetical protein